MNSFPFNNIKLWCVEVFKQALSLLQHTIVQLEWSTNTSPKPVLTPVPSLMNLVLYKTLRPAFAPMEPCLKRTNASHRMIAGVLMTKTRGMRYEHFKDENNVASLLL